MKGLFKIATAGASAAVLGFVAGPASAATLLRDCNPTEVTRYGVACSGWYAGNLLNARHIQDQKDALTKIGFNWNGDWSAIKATEIKPKNGDEYDFSKLLDGDTWIGVHKGKGAKKGIHGTVFFKLNANELDILKLNLKGGSSAVLYSTGAFSAVPEPATWALMIAGFGLAGAALRHRRDLLART